MQQQSKKSPAMSPANSGAQPLQAKSKKAPPGEGFAAQEAALKPKAEGGAKPKSSGLEWPLQDARGDMWDVLDKAFPDLAANSTGGPGTNQFSLRDKATGVVFNVRLEGGQEVMGEFPGTLFVTGDHCYTASAKLSPGDDVAAKVKALRPPAHG